MGSVGVVSWLGVWARGLVERRPYTIGYGSGITHGVVPLRCTAPLL